MLHRRSILSILAVAAIIYAVYTFWPRAITEAALERQLAGAHCRFIHDTDHCAPRGFAPIQSLLLERHDCDLWAVQCLAGFRTPEAVDGMIAVLSTKTDVQTCDGVYPIRSLAVDYLANSGERRAIEPLKRLLASRPVQTLSAGASGCPAGPENLDAIRTAIERLE